MVIRDKYHDEDDIVGSSANTHDDGDEPPSYETISGPAYPVPEKLNPQLGPGNALSGAGVVSTSSPVSRPSKPPSWFFASPIPSSGTSKQVRQTILILIRDLVLNTGSPNLLDSCANACRIYQLDLAALLQERLIENHSAMYWVILNHHLALLPTLLAYAAPLSESTKSEVYHACLATSDQILFQSLRCWNASLGKEMMPLSQSSGADILVLGSTSSDEISIHEIDGQGAFVAKMQINLWQKRMRVVGFLSIEFIARGRIWRLSFFTPDKAVGTWKVSLRLLEHSPPTFVDARLVVDPPPLPSHVSQAADLISLSPPPDDPNTPAATSSPAPSYTSKSKSKNPRTIEIRLSSPHRLAHRASNSLEQWIGDDGSSYTNFIAVSLHNGAGAELLYDNTPFVASDGTLHAHLEARLEKPEAECVIC